MTVLIGVSARTVAVGQISIAILFGIKLLQILKSRIYIYAERITVAHNIVSKHKRNCIIVVAAANQIHKLLQICLPIINGFSAVIRAERDNDSIRLFHIKLIIAHTCAILVSLFIKIICRCNCCAGS